jgi:uncharacterized protein with HEPN domain
MEQRFPEHREIIAMRNHIVHGYFGLDHQKVWTAAAVEAPPVVERVREILAELNAASPLGSPGADASPQQ